MGCGDKEDEKLTHWDAPSVMGHRAYGEAAEKVVPRFEGACPTCGDSIQSVRVAAPDHGQRRAVVLAWCMDCKQIKGYLVAEETL